LTSSTPSLLPVLFDANTLENFAVVDRLDLLQICYGDRAGWAEAVQFEIRMGVQSEVRLHRILSQSWLGEPIPVEGVAAILAVELIRRGVGGVVASRPTPHLGEAQTVFLLETSYHGGIFITGDRPAAHFARRRKIRTLDSAQVLNECFQMGKIGCPEAYELLGAMANENRGVRVPEHHGEVC
jgi:hypothetical protein